MAWAIIIRSKGRAAVAVSVMVGKCFQSDIVFEIKIQNAEGIQYTLLLVLRYRR